MNTVRTFIRSDHRLCEACEMTDDYRRQLIVPISQTTHPGDMPQGNKDASTGALKGVMGGVL